MGKELAKFNRILLDSTSEPVRLGVPPVCDRVFVRVRTVRAVRAYSARGACVQCARCVRTVRGVCVRVQCMRCVHERVVCAYSVRAVCVRQCALCVRAVRAMCAYSARGVCIQCAVRACALHTGYALCRCVHVRCVRCTYVRRARVRCARCVHAGPWVCVCVCACGVRGVCVRHKRLVCTMISPHVQLRVCY